MDLYGYACIDDLEDILAKIGFNPKMGAEDSFPRLRGLRLMEIEQPISEEEINKSIEQQKIDTAKQWLSQKSWDCWSSEEAFKKHKGLIYDDNEQEDCFDDRVIGYDLSIVDEKDKEIIEKEIELRVKAIRENMDMFNSYVGKKVLYINNRCGRGEHTSKENIGNRQYYEYENIVCKNKYYLSDVDDWWDTTYNDAYFDISSIDTSKYIKLLEDAKNGEE